MIDKVKHLLWIKNMNHGSFRFVESLNKPRLLKQILQ